METLVTQIRERYQATLEHIASAAKASGREPETVRLVVVTKAQPLEVVPHEPELGRELKERPRQPPGFLQRPHAGLDRQLGA